MQFVFDVLNPPQVRRWSHKSMYLDTIFEHRSSESCSDKPSDARYKNSHTFINRMLLSQVAASTHSILLDTKSVIVRNIHMKKRLISFLRWSERYTKTDMVYLATTGWWLNLNVVIMSVLSLLMSIIFANLLSPAAYGMYQYLLSLSVLVAAISLAGMNTAVAQAVARGYEGVLRTAVRTQLKWAVVPVSLSIATAIYYFLHGNIELGIGLTAIALFTPLSNAFNTYVGLLEGKREFRQMFRLGNLTNIISYASLVLAMLWVRDAAILVVVNLAVNTAVMAYCYYKTLRLYKPNDRVDSAALPYGRHLSVIGAFATIMNQLGSILVFHFLGAAELAIYGLATMLPERAGTLFSFIGTASMPKFANHPIAYIRENLLAKVAKIAFAAIIVAAAYALLAPFIFRLLFPNYPSAVSFSQFYAPIIALVAVTSVANMTLTAKRLTRELYVINFIQPLLLVGLQVALLLSCGIWGMIIAKLISTLVGVCLALWFTYYPLREPVEVM